MPVRIKRVLIYIYLILIRILIRKRRGKALLTVTVNELVLTVKLMVNKYWHKSYLGSCQAKILI